MVLIVFQGRAEEWGKACHEGRKCEEWPLRLGLSLLLGTNGDVPQG